MYQKQMSVADAALLVVAGLALSMVVWPRVRRMLRGDVKYVRPSAVKRRMDDGESMLVIDVRSNAEFTGILGHIPDAINLPHADFEDRVKSLSSQLLPYRDTPVVLVTYKDGNEVFEAYKLLLARGFTKVEVMDQGITEWIRSGLRVER